MLYKATGRKPVLMRRKEEKRLLQSSPTAANTAANYAAVSPEQLADARLLMRRESSLAHSLRILPRSGTPCSWMLRWHLSAHSLEHLAARVLLQNRWPRPLLMLYNATGAKPVLMRRKRLLKGSPTAEPQQQTMLLIVLLSS